MIRLVICFSTATARLCVGRRGGRERDLERLLHYSKFACLVTTTTTNTHLDGLNPGNGGDGCGNVVSDDRPAAAQPSLSISLFPYYIMELPSNHWPRRGAMTDQQVPHFSYRSRGVRAYIPEGNGGSRFSMIDP